MKQLVLSIAIMLAGASAFGASQMPSEKLFVNSVGMRLVRIEPGSFQMGCSNPTAAPSQRQNWRTFNGPEYLPNGDWDEHPVHKVVITYPFYMSKTEVTIEQFQQFRRDLDPRQDYSPYVSNISWNDAVAFCKWLSKKEVKPYRLPTEAEWEHACRVGTKSLFWSGNKPPKPGTANAWCLKNMHAPPSEWCMDWHGMYPDTEQVDPVGPEDGIARVIRGGGLDNPSEFYYRRSANRAGYVPDFPLGVTAEGIAPAIRGYLPVGFRVVMAPLPKTEPLPCTAPFIQQCVIQDTKDVQQGFDPEKPYFRKRYVFPVPPENIPKRDRRKAMLLVGLHPGFLDHNHAPGMDICSNGDIIAASYMCDHENEARPEAAVIAARLRFGAEQWDMPDLLIDLPDAADGGVMFWNDNGSLHMFCSSESMKDKFPFYWLTSTDNGATFGKIRFPVIRSRNPGREHPGNSAWRGADGMMYVMCDAGNGMLWTSGNNGKTWIDTGGRAGARHTTFAPLKDGRILGMGGKERSIDGFMPKAISSDNGRTYQITKSRFPALTSNQRPSLIRLASGRLLFATDFQNKFGEQPEGVKRKGAYLAYSEDEGETWTIKKIPGAQGHEHAHVYARAKATMIGYSVMRQGPDGLIHLMTSVNHPNLHFAFNEAWLLGAEAESDELPPEPAPTRIEDVFQRSERYANGRIKAAWSGGAADNGRYLLHGAKTCYYENGQKQWEVTYRLGRKFGKETYWSEEGDKVWSWQHHPDGTSTWTHWWPNGQKKSQSTWQDFKCEGVAKRWDKSGKIANQRKFVAGMLFD